MYQRIRQNPEMIESAIEFIPGWGHFAINGGIGYCVKKASESVLPESPVLQYVSSLGTVGVNPVIVARLETY